MASIPPSGRPPFRHRRPIYYSELSPGRKQLIREMHGIVFGRIMKLIVRGGEPVFLPRPEIEYNIRLLGHNNGPRPWHPETDFMLKAEIVALFAEFDKFGNCLVVKLEIRGGMPYDPILRES